MILSNAINLYRLNLSNSERKAMLLASLSGIFEFYDFIILGFMSIYFVNDVYNGTLTSHKHIFLFFFVLLIGYLFRPIGMKLYTKIAPCQNTVVVDGVITALAIIGALAIGLVPANNYKIALLVLFISRIIQGISGGADMQSNIDHLSIKAPDRMSISIFAVISANEAGIFLGVIINRVLNLMLNQAQMVAYGWRIMFFIGAIITMIIYLIRMKYSEPLTANHCCHRIIPLYKLVTMYPKRVFIALVFSGLRGSTTFIFLFLIPFILYYRWRYNVEAISHIMFITTILGSTSAFLMNNLLLNNKNIHYREIPKVMLVVSLISIPAMALLCYSLLINNYIILSILISSILIGWLRLMIPMLIIGLFPKDAMLSGFNFSNHSGFVICAALVIDLNLGVASLLHRILPLINYKTLFYLSLSGYLIILLGLTLFCLRKLNRYSNYDCINQLRNCLLNYKAK